MSQNDPLSTPSAASSPRSPSSSIRLVHHGAAASSNNHVLTWVSSSSATASNHDSNAEKEEEDVNNDETGADTLVYASHAMLNLAVHKRVALPNGRIESIWHVHETLRTRTCDEPSSSKRVITALAAMKGHDDDASRPTTVSCLACGFSDGTIVLWKQVGCDDNHEWEEFLLNIDMKHSVTVLDGVFLKNNDEDSDHILLAVGCSAGAFCYTCRLPSVEDADNHENKYAAATILSSHPLLETSAINAVYVHAPSEVEQQGEDCPILMLIGTAAPRHNKIHVYYHQTADYSSIMNNAKHPPPRPQYAGSLSGHEDWITCMDWKSCKAGNSALLASGSHDAIRLWNFATTMIRSEDHQEKDLVQEVADTGMDQVVDDDDEEDDDDDLHNDEQEQDEEGEARLEIISGKSRTAVTLEALLLGHEASVTSLSWHPQPQPIYGHDLLLISSSMDRSILLWSPSVEDGIWTPLTRVGSAGGILGGPIGSSLLGYCRAALEPKTGRYLIGHAYGGALHVWTLEDEGLQEMEEQALSGMSTEERASLVKWKATPSLTGHFNGVTDLCWEASRGAYLLTASNDQTCRLWAPVGADDEQYWVEMVRPQVHGYDLSAVASISTPEHPHFLVTGADEKELRAFDAPLSSLRIMKAAGVIDDVNDGVERVERAYIPSLGLTNKATVADSAEQDEPEGDDKDHQSLQDDTQGGKNGLLLERDLGAMSIWPEVRKLFGHNSELYCLASTLAARTAGLSYTPAKTCFLNDVLVASSAKARNVESAAIRLWDVEKGTCVQVLSGGHKSTVATLCFAPDGRCLASSGKDRRLCIWRRDESSRQFTLAWAKDSAHKRIIWSVHFCPFDESLLASGSRDGCVKLWTIEESSENGAVQALEICSFAPSFRCKGKPDSVTALSFAPRPLGDKTGLLALGLESGRLELWEVPRSVSGEEPRPYLLVPASLCHIATVTKLAWRPCQDASKASRHFLASSSMDCGCRLFQVIFN